MVGDIVCVSALVMLFDRLTCTNSLCELWGFHTAVAVESASEIFLMGLESV